jgi:hypothetical protein
MQNRLGHDIVKGIDWNVRLFVASFRYVDALAVCRSQLPVVVRHEMLWPPRKRPTLRRSRCNTKKTTE